MWPLPLIFISLSLPSLWEDVIDSALLNSLLLLPPLQLFWLRQDGATEFCTPWLQWLPDLGTGLDGQPPGPEEGLG